MAGDRDSHASADAFVEEHSARFLMDARKVAGRSLSRDEIDDLAADACLRVYRYLLRGGGIASSQCGLVYRTVLNTFIDKCRKRKREKEALEGLLDSARRPRVWRAAKRVAEVNECLMMLPVRQRQVIILHHVDGMTHAEIAAHLTISVTYSRVLLYRAEKRFREFLAARHRDGNEG